MACCLELAEIEEDLLVPMQSKAQRAYLWANHPELAREFEAATPKGKKLPKHVPKRKKKR